MNTALRVFYLTFVTASSFSLSACDRPKIAETAARPSEPHPLAATIEHPSKGASANSQEDTQPLERIVEAVMTREYGDSFEARLGCWPYVAEHGDESRNYCMKPGPAQIADTPTGKRLYFFAFSRPDISGDPLYIYSQNDTGLMGAFEIGLEVDGKWTMVASAKEMPFGSVGDCGCQQAKFTKLGKDYYGWMFASGGTWQGVSSIYHSLIAPHDGTFEDLSRIPMVEQELRDTEYRIEVDDSNPDEAVFPLRVSKIEEGKAPQIIKVEFNNEKRQFRLPASN